MPNRAHSLASSPDGDNRNSPNEAERDDLITNYMNHAERVFEWVNRYGFMFIFSSVVMVGITCAGYFFATEFARMVLLNHTMIKQQGALLKDQGDLLKEQGVVMKGLVVNVRDIARVIERIDTRQAINDLRLTNLEAKMDKQESNNRR